MARAGKHDDSPPIGRPIRFLGGRTTLELHRRGGRAANQSAVSRRIKALEAEVGVQLFTRTARGLKLTPAGEVLARRVGRAITEMGRAIAKLGETSATQPLRVTMLPSVASRWLMPRLPRFLELHRHLQVQVIADSRILDLRSEGIDLAIRFGRGRYRDHVATLLMHDWVLPVCSSQLLAARGPITSIDALLELPLLHDSSTEGDGSLSDWRSWLDQLGRPELRCESGQRLSHAGLSIEAAVVGLGCGACARQSRHGPSDAGHVSVRSRSRPRPHRRLPLGGAARGGGVAEDGVVQPLAAR